MFFVFGMLLISSCGPEKPYYRTEEITDLSRPYFYVDSTSFISDEDGPNGSDYWANHGFILVKGALDSLCLIETGAYDPNNPVTADDLKDSLAYTSFIFKSGEKKAFIDYQSKFFEKAIWIKYTPMGATKRKLRIKTKVE